MRSALLCVVARADTLYRTFVFRAYPTRAQAKGLDNELSEACRLYNAALQERREAHRRGAVVRFCEQSAQLPGIRAAGNIGLTSAGTAQEVLHRVDRTWRAFAARIQR